jgi:hypothetical protein
VSVTETFNGTAIGPLCGAAATGINCAVPGDGYTSPDKWAKLGAGYGPDNLVGGVSTSISQDTSIPAASSPQDPVILRFNLHIVDRPNGTGALTVRINGSDVFRATDSSAGYGFYTRVAVDISIFAGPGPRTILFDGFSVHGNGGTTGNTFYDSFQVDDISVTGPDLFTPLSPTGPTVASGHTGQRAAALKKCKKKKTRRARKKCRKKANALPL